MKVLIVEDQPAVAKALTVLFEIHDIAVRDRGRRPAAALAALRPRGRRASSSRT